MELAAARQELESSIEVIDERTAGARAEEERNALARRLAEEERARQDVAQQERAAREAARQEDAAREVRGAAAAQAGREAEEAGADDADPPHGSGGDAVPRALAAGVAVRHLDRVRRATVAEADLMARHPFGPVADLPVAMSPTGQVVEGMASWYGPGFDGRPTASGALFDQQGWTVASKELPLGTVLLVTRGGRSVLVLVNDRGPYVSGRVLDLSRAVAAELGTIGPGVAHVRAEVVRLP